MSDLVGNPEDRFSRVAAHMNLQFMRETLLRHKIIMNIFEFEFNENDERFAFAMDD